MSYNYIGIDMKLKDLIALKRYYPKETTLVFKVEDTTYDEVEITFSYGDDGKWKATITPKKK